MAQRSLPRLQAPSERLVSLIAAFAVSSNPSAAEAAPLFILERRQNKGGKGDDDDDDDGNDDDDDGDGNGHGNGNGNITCPTGVCIVISNGSTTTITASHAGPTPPPGPTGAPNGGPGPVTGAPSQKTITTTMSSSSSSTGATAAAASNTPSVDAVRPKKLSGGGIAGAVIGSLVIVGLALMMVAQYRRRARKARKRPQGFVPAYTTHSDDPPPFSETDTNSGSLRPLTHHSQANAYNSHAPSSVSGASTEMSQSALSTSPILSTAIASRALAPLPPVLPMVNRDSAHLQNHSSGDYTSFFNNTPVAHNPRHSNSSPPHPSSINTSFMPLSDSHLSSSPSPIQRSTYMSTIGSSPSPAAEADRASQNATSASLAGATALQHSRSIASSSHGTDHSNISGPLESPYEVPMPMPTMTMAHNAHSSLISAAGIPVSPGGILGSGVPGGGPGMPVPVMMHGGHQSFNAASPDSPTRTGGLQYPRSPQEILSDPGHGPLYYPHPVLTSKDGEGDQTPTQVQNVPAPGSTSGSTSSGATTLHRDMADYQKALEAGEKQPRDRGTLHVVSDHPDDEHPDASQDPPPRYDG